MDVLSKLGEMVVAALAVEGTLAIAKRLALVSGRALVTGDAGSYLGDWVEPCGWVVLALVWIVMFRLLREVASRVGLQRNTGAS
jgi:hypothetical protein